MCHVSSVRNLATQTPVRWAGREERGGGRGGKVEEWVVYIEERGWGRDVLRGVGKEGEC